MSYEFEITVTLERKLKKMQSKNKILLKICRNKINEIIQNPYHYKHLKYEDNH
jgi:mRNA-degrading endonuclease RelE of RelBE toxin-antitoxin system